jgi:ACS family pantothenate transporter-like MFS transporter
MTWTSLKGTARRALVGWRWYLFSALFMVSATAFEASGIYAQMGLWLKAEGGYTVEQINYYPTIVTAVAIVATIILTMCA